AQHSNPLHLLDTRLPPQHPIPDLVPRIPARPPAPPPDIHAAELGLDGAPRLQQHQAVPDPHGHLGLRRPGRGALARLGRRRQHVEALEILLDCGYGVAVVLAAAGAVARWLVGRAVLWCVGLHGVDSADSDVAVDGRALWALLGRVREWGGRLAVG
ncbi:hypothetical protein CIB48_g10467, partial [Xylaria polymorpha]